MFEKAFFLLLTHKCNMRCPHCYNELDPSKNIHSENKMLSVNKVITLFDSLEKQGFKKVMLSGGEALLHPNLMKILNEANKRNMKTALFTNGKSLNQVTIQKLYKVGLDELRISFNELVWIDSVEQYQTILSERIKLIQILKNTDIKVGCIYIISKKNIQFVAETYKKLSEMDITMKIQPLFLPKYDSNFEKVSASCIHQKDWIKLRKEFDILESCSLNLNEEKAKEVYGSIDEINKYIDLMVKTYIKGEIPNYCPTGPILVVDPSGDFHPCLFRHDIKIGSINNSDDIDSINYSLDYYKYFQNGECYREECLSAYR